MAVGHGIPANVPWLTQIPPCSRGQPSSHGAFLAGEGFLEFLTAMSWRADRSDFLLIKQTEAFLSVDWTSGLRTESLGNQTSAPKSCNAAVEIHNPTSNSRPFSQLPNAIPTHKSVNSFPGQAPSLHLFLRQWMLALARGLHTSRTPCTGHDPGRG